MGEEQGALSSTLPTSLMEQEVEPPPSPPTQSPINLPQEAVNFATFPHLTSNDYRAKENLALKIKAEMLACATREELAQFHLESGYGESAISWVMENALSETEKSDLEVINSISQPSLDLSVAASVEDEIPLVDSIESAIASEVVSSVESVSSEDVEAPIYQWEDMERETNLYMEQLGWTIEQGRAYFQAHYGVTSRRLLSDEPVLEF